MLSIIRTSLPFLILTLLSACLQADETESNGRGNTYTYRQIDNIDLYFLIVDSKDENLKSVSFTDLVIESKFSSGTDNGTPIYLFISELELSFYLPENFGENFTDWVHENCAYKILDTRKTPRMAQGPVVDYSIEQMCSQTDLIIRYLYSDFYGLQSITMGKYIKQDDNDPLFDVIGGYALWAQQKGFGAKKK